MERGLTTTRRQMLRMMFGGRRQSDESWVEWVQRATGDAEATMAAHSSEDWATLQRRRKFRLAGKAARALDGRWSHRLLSWRPHHGRGRRVGHPHKRWADDITKLAGGSWIEHTADHELWDTLQAAFEMGLD